MYVQRRRVADDDLAGVCPDDRRDQVAIGGRHLEPGGLVPARDQVARPFLACRRRQVLERRARSRSQRVAVEIDDARRQHEARAGGGERIGSVGRLGVGKRLGPECVVGHGRLPPCRGCDRGAFAVRHQARANVRNPLDAPVGHLYIAPQPMRLMALRRCAVVAQSVRVPACHAGGRGFEPRQPRHLSHASAGPKPRKGLSRGEPWRSYLPRSTGSARGGLRPRDPRRPSRPLRGPSARSGPASRAARPRRPRGTGDRTGSSR